MARPRSAAAHLKVLNAAAELVAGRGIEAASMDAIAQKSGVSKATIYKHWADKDALLLEMMAHIYGLSERPNFDTGNARADVIAVLSHRPDEDNTPLREMIWRVFATYSQTRPEFGVAWKNLVMDPPRRELRAILKSAIDKGELDASLDMELSLALLLGPLMYWFIFLRITNADPKTVAVGVADSFWRAYGTKKEHT